MNRSEPKCAPGAWGADAGELVHKTPRPQSHPYPPGDLLERGEGVRGAPGLIQRKTLGFGDFLGGDGKKPSAHAPDH